jgi:hypothetical protein
MVARLRRRDGGINDESRDVQVQLRLVEPGDVATSAPVLSSDGLVAGSDAYLTELHIVGCRLCGSAITAKGLCVKHYRRLQRHGDPEVVHRVRGGTKADHFWPKVNKDGPIPDYAPDLGQCWIWTRAHFKLGYGAFWYDGKLLYAHIVSYELEVGLVPAGLELDHLCRVRDCVRPTHLEPVTHLINVRRSPLLYKHGRRAMKATS